MRVESEVVERDGLRIRAESRVRYSKDLRWALSVVAFHHVFDWRE